MESSELLKPADEDDTGDGDNDFLREMMEYEAQRKKEQGETDEDGEPDDFIKQM